MPLNSRFEHFLKIVWMDCGEEDATNEKQLDKTVIIMTTLDGTSMYKS